MDTRHQDAMSLKRKMGFASAILALLVTFFSNGGFLAFNPWLYAFAFAIFLLGAFFGAFVQDEPDHTIWIDKWTESDWRKFDFLIEMTGGQLDTLRELVRLKQTAEAKSFLEKEMGILPGYSEDLLEFFIESNWATCGRIGN